VPEKIKGIEEVVERKKFLFQYILFAGEAGLAAGDKDTTRRQQLVDFIEILIDIAYIIEFSHFDDDVILPVGHIFEYLRVGIAEEFDTGSEIGTVVQAPGLDVFDRIAAEGLEDRFDGGIVHNDRGPIETHVVGFAVIRYQFLFFHLIGLSPA